MKRTVRYALLAGGFVLVAGTAYLARRQSSPARELPRFFQTPHFELVNSRNEVVRSENLYGSVWLVNFIFTRCTGPCPVMTQRMHSIQRAVAGRGLPGKRVRFVSITVDPGYDSPEVLAEYASNRKINLENWDFLTGPSDAVVGLVEEGFKTAVGRLEGGPLVHGTHFLLFDDEGWARALFHLEEANLTQNAVEAISALLGQMPQP